jgi:hypothetical protein
LRCAIATDSQATSGQYGGAKLLMPPFEALRLLMSFDNPENIALLSVYAYDSQRNQVEAWHYRFYDVNLPDAAPASHSFVLAAGQDSRPFRNAGVRRRGNVDANAVEIVAQVRPGASAGFTIQRIEYARAVSAPTEIGERESTDAAHRPRSGLENRFP